MTTINDRARSVSNPIRRTSVGGSGVNGAVSLKVVKVIPAVLLMIMLITTVMPAGVSATSAFAASSLTFTASADAQVKETNPDSNFGTSTYLQVDGDSGASSESYLLFDVSGLSGAVSSAVLRVYDSTNGSTNGPALFRTDAGWTENNITWGNRPSRITPELGNVGNVGTDIWVEYDVTSQVTADGAYSFALVADSNDGLTFSSREGGQAPQLVITMGSSSVSTPTVVASTPTAAPISPVEPDAATSAVLVGAGDISSCGNNNDEATAKLLDGISGTVYTVGDNVYSSGTSTEYQNCYNPTWGRHKSRTKPVPGNHDYNTSGASGYFRYFNNPPSYYAYNLGGWRIYALNSEISVSSTSAQVSWLKNDLAANPTRCVLAYWHKPRWSSGQHGSSSAMQTLWKTLYDAGADVILNGHDHDYERFAPMNASGSAVSSGMREFVVGTGGASHYSFGSILPASQVRNSTTYGVLKLTLNSTSYSWKFVPVAGKTFTDTGTTNCR